MPGVIINTAVRTGPSTPTAREASQAFFAGICPRGPVTGASLVNSLEEFSAIYGPYTSTSMMHPTVEAFFEEGGTQCYIARSAQSSAVSATITVLDATAGTPLVAFTLTANGPGTWGNNLMCVVAAGTKTASVTAKIYYENGLLFNTFNCDTNEQIVGKINSDPVASKYIIATIGVSSAAIAAPATRTLATGANGTASTQTQIATALDLFSDSLGTGAVSCPDGDAASVTVNTALVAHANAKNRIAILHGASDASVSTIKTFARAITADIASSEHAALYYPWVYAPTSVAGVTRLIPPDGYVCGKRSAAVNATGPHQPYAGLQSSARFISGVVTDVDKDAGDLLDAESVNAIRVISNTVRIYGARSLSPDSSNFRYINAQDIVNGIVVDGYKALESVVFSTIDGRNNSFASVEAKLIAVLEQSRLAGALYEAFDANGRRVDFGYTVKCDSSLNPVSQLATGLVKARVGVRVSSVGDKIEVNIIKSNLTTSVI